MAFIYMLLVYIYIWHSYISCLNLSEGLRNVHFIHINCVGFAVKKNVEITRTGYLLNTRITFEYLFLLETTIT